MNALLGMDLGTSGAKLVLFDEDGQVLGSATKDYPLYQPRNGWAEQHPEDWWQAVCLACREVLAQSGVSPEEIRSIGLSGQMHGLVLLDETGAVLRPCILWCDGRTTEECAEITETVGKQRLVDITANPALPGFTAGKLLWVRKHEPELYTRCAHVLLPKDYIRYRLTGVFASDVSDASGTNLLDVPRRQWSEEILRLLHIDESLLPRLYESPEITGAVSDTAASLTGLAPGTPVVGGAGDNAAAAVGTGVVETGRAFTTIGTSGVVFAHSDTVAIDPQGRVHTFCHAVPGCYTVMSCTLAAGLSLQWFRNTFCGAESETARGMGVDSYYILDKQAENIPIGAHRLLYLPYLMGERSPILDETSRGVFFGLSAIHTKADLLRAVMEGVTYSQRQNLDILRGMGVPFDTMLACGGGGSSPLWRQMLADVFGCPVSTTVSKEGPALGVALLAGVGAGIYPTVQEACRRVVRVNPPQQPDAARQAQYEAVYRVYLQLYPALRGVYPSLAALND